MGDEQFINETVRREPKHNNPRFGRWAGKARRAWLLLSIWSLQELSAQDNRDHEPRNAVILQGLRREPRVRTAALLQSSGEGHT